eukprot:533017-Pelagomonas_calceolata.AAC.7
MAVEYNCEHGQICVQMLLLPHPVHQACPIMRADDPLCPIICAPSCVQMIPMPPHHGQDAGVRPAHAACTELLTKAGVTGLCAGISIQRPAVVMLPLFWMLPLLIF